MKRINIIFLVVVILIGLLAFSIMMMLDEASLKYKEYEPDAEMESYYQQMLKPDGSIDPFIFDSVSELNAKQLGALILATQKCTIASEEVPTFGSSCTPILAIAKYQEKTLNIPDKDILDMAKSLAFHPDEYVRVNNLSFLIPAFNFRPVAIFDYLLENRTPYMDFYAYRVINSRNIAIKEALVSMRNTPEYTQYHEKLLFSGNPMVRSWAYEENMTPEQIADTVENSLEGIKKVFHADKVVTPKEAMATFLLFQHCKFKDSDLSLDGDCFAIDPFRQLSKKRMFIQEELDLPGMLLKMGKHKDASVRGLAWSMSYHLYPDKLKKFLEDEKDVKAVAAFVYFSKLFGGNAAELEPFYDQLKSHPDPRVKALVGDIPLSAEEFEAHLLKLRNCEGKNSVNCPEFLEFSSWFKSYSNLPIEEKAVIAPIIDKYFNDENKEIQAMTHSLGIVMGYLGLMPKTFDEYWNNIAMNGSNDDKIAVFMTLCVYGQMDPEGIGSDMELKAKLQKMSETMEPMDRKALRDEMLQKSFK